MALTDLQECKELIWDIVRGNKPKTIFGQSFLCSQMVRVALYEKGKPSAGINKDVHKIEP